MHKERSSLPRVLTIAGSDSSGGAGIEADIKTITVHGCYGMTCITGLTAQNTLGVRDIQPIGANMIQQCLDAVSEDIGIDSIKIGMLSSKEAVDTVKNFIVENCRETAVVVDPVMVSTSGSNLIPVEALNDLINGLFPRATMITPNIIEAETIAKFLGHDIKIKSLADVRATAKILAEIGPEAVLIKGGHMAIDGYIVDVLYWNHHFYEIKHVLETTNSTHGTGCTLSSAIACNLAKGDDIHTAVLYAIRFVHKAISTAQPLGHGHGPVNHMHNMYIRPFVQGHFVEYLLSQFKVKNIWSQYVGHEFVRQLSRNTLQQESFKHFMIQDYKYLTHYARAHGLAAYKADSLDMCSRSAGIICHIKREMTLHIEYCSLFGIQQSDLEKASESTACIAYSRFILDIGVQQDWLALQMALAPCLLGYRDAAQRCMNDPKSVREGNSYWKWVDNYVSPDYLEAVSEGEALLERAAAHVSAERLKQLIEIFIKATEMECEFWTSALQCRN